MNLPGRDLYVFEVGPSREPASIEISEDGQTWIDAGVISGGKSSIDLEDKKIPQDIVYYYLRVTDLKGMCKSKTAGADIDAIAAVNSVIKLTINADVLFDVAKFRLKDDAHKILVVLSETIKKVDKATIRIEGHTDSDGGDKYNQTLSENRSLVVKDRIEALLGYDALYDYEIKAFGETKPKLENTTVENKKMNRRVEITVLPPRDYYKSLRLKK
jgi:outer membrane protein OmpA-like peptidoglycan-associated protein